MRSIFTLVIYLIVGQSYAQESLDDLLTRFNANDIPYITVHEVMMPKTDAIILDVREKYENEVSRIPGATFLNNDFTTEELDKIIANKNQLVVVYCTVGIRSEIIARKIQKAGYSNVKNLYGGIFEWKNNGFQLEDNKGKTTEKVHTYAPKWEKYLKQGVPVN